jgi:hypothetical protein
MQTRPPRRRRLTARHKLTARARARAISRAIRLLQPVARLPAQARARRHRRRGRRHARVPCHRDAAPAAPNRHPILPAERCHAARVLAPAQGVVRAARRGVREAGRDVYKRVRGVRHRRACDARRARRRRCSASRSPLWENKPRCRRRCCCCCSCRPKHASAFCARRAAGDVVRGVDGAGCAGRAADAGLAFVGAGVVVCGAVAVAFEDLEVVYSGKRVEGCGGGGGGCCWVGECAEGRLDAPRGRYEECR